MESKTLEVEINDLYTQGKSVDEIAESLGLSVSDVIEKILSNL